MSTNQETTYIKRGLIFGICILLIAGNVYYDDVYNDGMSSSLKYKWHRLKEQINKSDSPKQKALPESQEEAIPESPKNLDPMPSK